MCFGVQITVYYIRNYIWDPKLHLGPEWRIFHILTSEDIDDIISRSFTAVRCKQSVKNGER